jgi:hypothetical protein
MKSISETSTASNGAAAQIAELVRDVETLMQSPETVEIGQLAKLIERLNGEFSLMRGQSAVVSRADADLTDFDFEALNAAASAGDQLEAQQVAYLASLL